MYDVILSFITAFTLTYFAIPSIIHIAEVKNLCDEPGERRSHTTTTPPLGGIAIFAGVLFSVILWTPFNVFGDLQYILCAFIIIFLIGAKDDIIPMTAGKKMVGQLFAASILVFKSNVLLSGLHGVFGIGHLPYFAGVFLTIFTVIVIINSFNLIDGINGLSGSIGTLICITFGTWFFLVDRIELTIVSFALAGATVAFLKYNFSPAQIFMGDTGALFLGLIVSILAIEFIETNSELAGNPYTFKAAPAVTIGILILPLFDTLRVFTMRAIRKTSPFKPDRTHIHHLLIDSGFSHMQATLLLVMVNMVFIFTVFTFQHIGTTLLLLLIFSLATMLTALLFKAASRNRGLRLSSKQNKQLV